MGGGGWRGGNCNPPLLSHKYKSNKKVPKYSLNSAFLPFYVTKEVGGVANCRIFVICEQSETRTTIFLQKMFIFMYATRAKQKLEFRFDHYKASLKLSA